MSDKEDFCPSISQHCLAPAAAPSQQQAGGDQTEDGGQYGGAAQPEPAREPLAVRLSPHPSLLSSQTPELLATVNIGNFRTK